MARNGQDSAVVHGVGMQIQQPGAASLCGGRAVGDEPFVTALRDVGYGQQQRFCLQSFETFSPKGYRSGEESLEGSRGDRVDETRSDDGSEPAA